MRRGVNYLSSMNYGPAPAFALMHREQLESSAEQTALWDSQCSVVYFAVYMYL